MDQRSKEKNLEAKDDQDSAQEQGKPELHPQDQPAEPGNRGGSLLPRENPEKVDESSDESFPASDAPAWGPSQSG